MEKIQKVPKLVTIAILTVITIVFWIGFGIYRIFTKSESTPLASDVTLPLSPTLDQSVLSGLKNRLVLTDNEIGETILTTNESTPAATATPEETPEATATATPTATPEATQSAQATGSGQVGQ